MVGPSMPTPLKQTIIALQEAIQRSQASGEAVALDVDVDQATLDALAFVLGCSVSFVELPGGGQRIEGEGAGGEFTLLRNEPDLQ